MLAKFGNIYPDSLKFTEISTKFTEQFTADKIKKELAYFEMPDTSFERTYGWAWLLKLQLELQSSESDLWTQISKILKPLSENYIKSKIHIFNNLKVQFVWSRARQ